MDTSVLGALLGLLGTPASVGVEQPSLEHFSIDSSLAGQRVSGGGAGGGSGPARSAVVLWVLCVVMVVALTAAAVSRQRRRRLSRLRALAVAPLLLLVGVMTVTAAQGTLFGAAPSGTPATLALANAASHAAPAASSRSTSGSTLFTRVVAFETQIAAAQAELTSPSASQGVALLREERSLATSLEGILQQEYNFFAAVAHDSTQASALLQAAAIEPAKVRNVVTYNVQAVQAQLAQQAAIAQASQTHIVIGPVAVPAIAAAVATPPGSAALVWPMSGVITQGFGASPFAIEPAVTLAGITYPHFHTGIDIAAPFETPVQSAADGVVALAGAETDGLGHLVGYGNYVVVAHGNGMVTLYGHLAQVLVQPGQVVHAGDPIGREGSTGNSTGPHVHFELRVNGSPANPASYVQPR
ncbi:MAG: M23 family metallopeptidase [Candidatus Dormibacteraeota bacterium]|nr:M23 family metallopeptidase [Candidatus Dormibacteraeota bacterium]